MQQKLQQRGALSGFVNVFWQHFVTRSNRRTNYWEDKVRKKAKLSTANKWPLSYEPCALPLRSNHCRQFMSTLVLEQVQVFIKFLFSRENKDLQKKDLDHLMPDSEADKRKTDYRFRINNWGNMFIFRPISHWKSVCASACLHVHECVGLCASGWVSLT